MAKRLRAIRFPVPESHRHGRNLKQLATLVIQFFAQIKTVLWLLGAPEACNESPWLQMWVANPLSSRPIVLLPALGFDSQ